MAAGGDWWSCDETLSVIRRSLNLKFGIYGELNQNNEGPKGNFGGGIAFDGHPTNLLDGNYDIRTPFSACFLDISG